MPIFAANGQFWLRIQATFRLVPNEDLLDLYNGATYVPPQVTAARRNGNIVTFVRDGAQKDWYWKLPDGTQITHGEVAQ